MSYSGRNPIIIDVDGYVVAPSLSGASFARLIFDNDTNKLLISTNGGTFKEIDSGPVSLTSGVTGTLPVANGGTGLASAGGTANSILWSTNGTSVAWTNSPVVGKITVTQVAATSGSPTAVTITGAAHTTLAASTEAIDVLINLSRSVEFSDGALATQRAIVITEPTYAFVSPNTITNAATFYINDAPVAGSNATITNKYALWVGSGNIRFGGLSTGIVHASSAGLLTSSAVSLTADVTGVLPVANGGTGVNSAGGVANSVLWSTDGTAVAWTNSPVIGKITVTQVAATSGSPNAAVITGAAHTTLAASVEATDILWSLNRTVQFNTGALATQRAVYIRAPTYGFVAASTLTDAATVAIEGAPAQGTNATITNKYALWVAAGNIRFGGLGTGIVHSSSVGLLTSSAIVNADVDAAAAIAVSKLAAGSNGQVLTTTGGVPVWGAASTTSQGTIYAAVRGNITQ